MVWVLEDAPDLPPHLVGLMMGLANHADSKGQAAYPSIDLLSWYARKERRATRRDLKALTELGLIRKGNQAYVLHLPPDKRPVVYDLAIERRRSRTSDTDACGKPGGPVDPPASDKADNTDTTGISRGSTGPSGGVCETERGGLWTPLTVLEPSLNQTPLPPTPSQPAAIVSAHAETRGGIFGEPENRTDKAPTHQYIPDPDPVMLACSVCQLPERHYRHSAAGRRISPPATTQDTLTAAQLAAAVQVAKGFIGALVDH
jgi:hypothetical protein